MIVEGGHGSPLEHGVERNGSIKLRLVAGEPVSDAIFEVFDVEVVLDRPPRAAVVNPRPDMRIAPVRADPVAAGEDVVGEEVGAGLDAQGNKCGYGDEGRGDMH